MDPVKGHDLATQSTCTTCEFSEDLSEDYNTVLDDGETLMR